MMMLDEKHYRQPYLPTAKRHRTPDLPLQFSVYIYPEQETTRPDELQVNQICWSETPGYQYQYDIFPGASKLFKDYQNAVERLRPAETQLPFPAEASTFNPQLFERNKKASLLGIEPAFELAAALEMIALKSHTVLESGLMSITERQHWLAATKRQHFINSLLERQAYQEHPEERVTGESVLQLEALIS